MKNFEERYKEFIKNVNLSNSEYETIKSNVLNNKKAKTFKLRYAYILIFIAFVSFVGVVSASKIINHMKIDINEEKNIKEVTASATVDKDYDSALFENGNYYTYDEIEEKLGFKILKSSHYDSDLFMASPEAVDGKLSSVVLDMVNSDKSKRSTWSRFSVFVATKYAETGLHFKVAGITSSETYYIKSLGVEASIIYLDMFSSCAIIHFVYNDVMYELTVNNDHNFETYEEWLTVSKEEMRNDIIEILESLTLE